MIAIGILTLAVSALGGVEALPPEPGADVLMPALLAQVIGEAGGIGIWGTEEAMHGAWRCLMHVALNRHQDPDFPTARRSLQGFYRLERSPPLEAIEMAREVMMADDDPTEGSLYALSVQDLELLGIKRDGDFVLLGKGVFELHLFREWHAAGTP